MCDDTKAELLRRIEEALRAVRPHLNADGGDVEVVDVTDDMYVQVRWTGMCESCAMSEMTLRAGIAEAIKGKIPEIAGVIAVN
ncbi:MAG: NifU family protein [Saprospiraceae bacterium]|nr:NifU family protein [Saprospiraceae bacterium]MDW8483177.1 NifU family protein [Saprospiraceae bacterium]